VRLFSGIQPTGRKHLGNYVGAIRGWVEAQDRGDGIYCMVDLHAVTVPYDPVELRSYVLDTTAILMAAGLDPERCLLFRQSDVREHTELAWLIGAVTAHGDLNRMTQFKDKSARQRELVSAGIFFYPVLQAADILLYKTDEVPVGDDQRQHLELARDIAQRFNDRFGETFVVPRHVIPEIGGRIMDLQTPDSKMSTTAPSPAGTILLLDDDKTIVKKVKSAVTDSGSEVRRAPDKAGISNLIEIMAVATGRSPEEVEREFEGKGYGDFKSAVADAVAAYVRPIRDRYNELRPEESRIEAVLEEGAGRARAIAQDTMEDVRARMGIGPVHALP
jgi:tryptophanyl-tRNA synthetase